MKYQFTEQDGQHLHTLDGKPLTGTSSIEAVLSKPLTYWAAGLAVSKFGWLNPKKHTPEECATACEEGLNKIRNLTRDEYGNLLDEAYRAHSVKLKDSAEAGTDLHNILERYVKSLMNIKESQISSKEYNRINPFILWAMDNVERFLWSEAHCFDEDLWVGGISDAGAELKTGQYAIIDFKSSKEAYTNQFIQAAGYAIQIDKNGLWSKNGKLNKKLNKPISALIVVPFGAETIKPEIRYGIEEYKKGFEWCVGLYRLLGYDKQL